MKVLLLNIDIYLDRHFCVHGCNKKFLNKTLVADLLGVMEFTSDGQFFLIIFIIFIHWILKMFVYFTRCLKYSIFLNVIINSFTVNFRRSKEDQKFDTLF